MLSTLLFLPLGVRHRIDGLEIHEKAQYAIHRVRHRIDGLEMV